MSDPTVRSLRHVPPWRGFYPPHSTDDPIVHAASLAVNTRPDFGPAGSRAGTRTRNLPVQSRPLYRLSYAAMLAWPAGPSYGFRVYGSDAPAPCGASLYVSPPDVSLHVARRPSTFYPTWPLLTSVLPALLYRPANRRIMAINARSSGANAAPCYTPDRGGLAASSLATSILHCALCGQ